MASTSDSTAGGVASAPTTYATSIAGSTGLVGGHMLTTLLTHPLASTVSAFARRALDKPDPNSRLRPIIDTDSSNWKSDFSTLQPKPDIFYSGLGTTRAQAGGFEAQRKIDYDLNLDLAKAARDQGVKIYVLISSSGVSKTSVFPYSKMKGELEDAVSKLEFEKVVLVKPGLIIGAREDKRYAEYALQVVANFLGRISGGLLKDGWAQDADVIGRAAVNAGFKALQKDSDVPDGKVWAVGISDILRLGKADAKTQK